MIPCSLLLRSVRCFQKKNISKKQSVTDILRQTVLFKRIISNLLAFLIILFFYIIYFYFSSLLLQVRTCVRVFLFFFPHSRCHDVEENLRLHVSSERVSPSRGEGGTWLFFGGVCAVRDSKLAPPFPLAPRMKSLWHPGYRALGTLVKRQQKILSHAFYIFLSLASLRHREVSRKEREPIDPTLASQADVPHCPTSRAGTHDEPLRTSAGQ